MKLPTILKCDLDGAGVRRCMLHKVEYEVYKKRLSGILPKWLRGQKFDQWDPWSASGMLGPIVLFKGDDDERLTWAWVDKYGEIPGNQSVYVMKDIIRELKKPPRVPLADFEF